MHVEKDHSSEVELGCDLPSLVHRLIGVAVRDLGRQDIADFVVLKNGYGSMGQSRALTAGGYEGIDLDLVLQVIPSCNTGVVQRFLRNSWRRQAFFWKADAHSSKLVGLCEDSIFRSSPSATTLGGMARELGNIVPRMYRSVLAEGRHRAGIPPDRGSAISPLRSHSQTGI
jgi:hypothetical protein